MVSLLVKAHLRAAAQLIEGRYLNGAGRSLGDDEHLGLFGQVGIGVRHVGLRAAPNVHDDLARLAAWRMAWVTVPILPTTGSSLDMGREASRTVLPRPTVSDESCPSRSSYDEVPPLDADSQPGRTVIVVLCNGLAVTSWPLPGARPVDMALIDALARLQLTARRLGCRVHLENVHPHLSALLVLSGLGDLLATDPPGQTGGPGHPVGGDAD